MKKSTTLLFACFAGIALQSAAEDFSYVDLVHRVTNLEYVATIPASGDQCSQWSSYDRKSRYDSTTGKYVNWDANGDGDGVIRKEDGKLVFAEMKGPGCIWRTWSAAPKDGHVRIYLDGATEPAIDLSFMGYFDRKNAPFTRPNLVHMVSRGWNNYVPIPYQKSCKIVADPGWGAYFHFNYETFPEGTHVPTFHRDLSAEENAALDAADQALSNLGPRAGRFESWTADWGPAVKERSSSANLTGPAAITSIKVKLDLPTSPADREALRGVTIQIQWDGESEPSVWAPLGDFFGTAPGANQYSSLPAGLTKDGWWYCNWYMPFAKSARVTFLNEAGLSTKLEYQIATEPLRQDPSRYARFHAKWHRDALPPAEPERKIDWTVLKTEGAGRFVGMMLHIWNPRGGWWGEGDEKFFVDGEKFPSTFGTGSEDYFGYAWSDPRPFQHALHNQTHNDGNSKGHISVNRWHISDNVPFQKSFEGCIEKYYSNERPTLYAGTAFWYLAPGGTDPYQAAPLAERVGYWTPVQSAKVEGALEGEDLKILGHPPGQARKQELDGFGGSWSNDAHLWWTDARPGDELALSIPVRMTGRYKPTLQLTRAPDYGIVQLYLDDQPLGENIDLYNATVVPTGPLQFGERELTAGDHNLRVKIVGANPKAVKSYMFGLDYIKLELVPITRK